MNRTLLPILFSYDGAPDSRNACPVCEEPMMWHNLEPFREPLEMVCEDCELICDVRTEAVWQVTL